MTVLRFFFKTPLLISSCVLIYWISFMMVTCNLVSSPSNTSVDIVLDKNDITQYYFSSVSEPLDITDKEFSMFVMYLKHRLKKKLLTDVALQQQVVGTCAKTICGIFHHHVYDPIENQCRSFKHNLESELKSKPYFELTRAGRKTLAKQPV